MKKIIFTLVLILTISATYSQGKYHKRQNVFYVESAAKEYNLNEDQQKELSEARMEMVTVYITKNQAFKAGDITKEEKKTATRKASKIYHNKLSKITGKSYNEMKPWLAEMRKKIKEVK